MKKITLLFAFLITSLGFSQTYDLLASLNGTNLEGTFGGTAAEYVTDPSGSDQVVRITSNPGEIWQGVNFNNFTSNFRLTSATQLTMQLDVYSTTAITIAPKAQGGVSGAPESITTASHTGSGTWETLTFTFNQSLDGKVPANGDYTDFALHINWNTGANTFGAPDGRIFYIKNLKGLSAAPVVDPAPTTAAPTPPARAAADVKSIFSDAYTPIATLNYAGVDGQPSNDNTFNTSWCPGATSLVQVAGNNTNKVTGLGCEGISFLSGRFDATSFTHFHIDIWTNTATLDKSFNMKFSNWNGGAGEANAIEFSTTNASNPALPNPNPGTWISLDIPLSAWTTGSRNDLVQFIITSNLGTVYYDNLYLHKNTTLGTSDFQIAGLKVYPNPSKDSWNVQTANVKMSSIQVYDILGKNILSVSPNDTKARINATSLKAGIYFAKINTANGSSSIKLVKE